MQAARFPLFTAISEKLISMSRWSKVMLMLVADAIALPVCFLCALILFFGSFERPFSVGIAPYLIIAFVTVSVFMVCGLYRAVIRFIDQRLLTVTGAALAIVVIASYLIAQVVEDLVLHRSALMIYWFIAFAYVVSSRLLVRAFLRKYTGRSHPRKNTVAIYGAGEAGEQLALAIRLSKQYRAACFFDDMQGLNNHSVAGLKVFHASRMAEIKEHFGIGMVVLAIPSATAERRRQIMHQARSVGLEIKTLATLTELAEDEISTKSIREIKIEDLLGRAPVPPQPDLLAKCITGRHVLVTGGGGSIGSELSRQIGALDPLSLHLLDHSEYGLYQIEQELRGRFPNLRIEAHLGSVCDAPLVESLLSRANIHTIYHAAAYKHVPLVEANISEGIRNNVVGAEVIVSAAKKCKVQTCVLISSDKAVRPTNIMGATKRIAEMIFQAAALEAGTKTIFSMVRFGNVLGSSGSVVPLFKKQIEQGGPITITHPDMVRYFMLIPEAAQLVIQAGSMAKGGEVFLLDMGEPVKIVELARTMIAMMGLQEITPQEPDGDIAIEFVGLRDGEKLYEELLIGPGAIGSSHPRIMCTREYSFTTEVLTTLIADLKNSCRTGNPQKIKSVMQKIVWEYAPQQADEPEVIELEQIAGTVSTLHRPKPAPVLREVIGLQVVR